LNRDRKEAEPLNGFHWSGPSQEAREELEAMRRKGKAMADASARVRDLNGGINHDPRRPVESIFFPTHLEPYRRRR